MISDQCNVLLFFVIYFVMLNMCASSSLKCFWCYIIVCIYKAFKNWRVNFLSW
jgi:hypothetical protein